jgi:precorrin-2 dehydrogenase/sirohydrochlorin ferrochelatase
MHYPLFLDLADRPVVVIGAGNVATRKIRTLLAAGACVTVISPGATLFIAERASRPLEPKRRTGETPVLLQSKSVHWIRRHYRRGDLRGACLVIAATDNPTVNELVCAEANRRRLLVNCVAPPSAGNFIVPAQVQRGGITLAISTGGASPAFAKRLRRDLERFLSDGYPALLKKMANKRRAGRNTPKSRS